MAVGGNILLGGANNEQLVAPNEYVADVVDLEHWRRVSLVPKLNLTKNKTDF